MSGSQHGDEPTVSALDDIFGSSPSDGGHDELLKEDNPSMHGSASMGAGAAVDVDVTDGTTAPTATAGAGAGSSAHAQDFTFPTQHEPSDLPSVRRQHVTNGYRAGIILAKQEHLQRGFDEGYPFGAKLGLRAGIVKGVLEGLMKSRIEDPQIRKTVIDLKHRAEEELEVSKVFAKAAAAVAPGASEETAAAAAVSAVAAGDKAYEPPAPHVILDEIGDQVITEWEDTINGLLAQVAVANADSDKKKTRGEDKKPTTQTSSALGF